MKRKIMFLALLTVLILQVSAEAVYYENTELVADVSVTTRLYFDKSANRNDMSNEFRYLKTKAKKIAQGASDISGGCPGNVYIIGRFIRGVYFQVTASWFYNYDCGTGSVTLHRGEHTYDSSLEQMYMQMHYSFNSFYADYERECNWLLNLSS